MTAAAIVLGAAVLLLVCGGSFKAVRDTDVRALWLPLAAIALQPLTAWVCALFSVRGALFAAGLTLCYILCAVFIVLNRRVLLFSLPAAAGVLCNYAVIALNDFYMPVAREVLTRSGFTGIPAAKALFYRIADGGERLGFLADNIWLPVPGGFASIGDVFATIGIVFLAIYLFKPGSRLFAKTVLPKAR